MKVSAEDAAVYYESLGPWVTAEAVAEYCNLTEQQLLEWTESRRLLGVEFADGKYYYQARQFKDGGPVVGLDRILGVLAPGVRGAGIAGGLAGWQTRLMSATMSPGGICSTEEKWSFCLIGPRPLPTG